MPHVGMVADWRRSRHGRRAGARLVRAARRRNCREKARNMSERRMRKKPLMPPFDFATYCRPAAPTELAASISSGRALYVAL